MSDNDKVIKGLLEIENKLTELQKLSIDYKLFKSLNSLWDSTNNLVTSLLDEKASVTK